MPVAECEKEAPPVASIKQQKQQQQQRGGENEIQNSTGETDSLQQNFNIDVDCESESLQNGDEEVKLTKILKGHEDVISLFNTENMDEMKLLGSYFEFLSMKSTSQSKIDVVLKEISESGDGRKFLDRETLSSVNVKRDNKNEHHDDVDNKNNNVEGTMMKDGRGKKKSLGNSSLTSKDSSDCSLKIAKIATMMMRMKSSKEFHRENFHRDDNDDEVGSASSTDLLSQSYVCDEMIDDSETAHFTPSFSSGLVSLSSAVVRQAVPTVAHRVKFRSSTDCKNNNNNHPPQMEPLSTVVEEIDSSSLTDDSSAFRSLTSSVCINKKLPRFPVQCPLTTNCDSCSVPSDFCNHITIDHPSIDISKVTPGKLTNMTINHEGNIGMVTCQRMFLVSDKVT